MQTGSVVPPLLPGARGGAAQGQGEAGAGRCVTAPSESRRRLHRLPGFRLSLKCLSGQCVLWGAPLVIGELGSLPSVGSQLWQAPAYSPHPAPSSPPPALAQVVGSVLPAGARGDLKSCREVVKVEIWPEDWPLDRTPVWVYAKTVSSPLVPVWGHFQNSPFCYTSVWEPQKMSGAHHTLKVHWMKA